MLGLTSWSTCCYMSINCFLGERKGKFYKMLAVFLQQQEIVFRQVGIIFDISLWSLACPVLSVDGQSCLVLLGSWSQPNVPLKGLRPAKVLLSISPESLYPSGFSSTTPHLSSHSLFYYSGSSGSGAGVGGYYSYPNARFSQKLIAEKVLCCYGLPLVWYYILSTA